MLVEVLLKKYVYLQVLLLIMNDHIVKLYYKL